MGRRRSYMRYLLVSLYLPYVFFFMVAGHVINNLLCFISWSLFAFFIAIMGLGLFPRYTYGLCWLMMGIDWLLKLVFVSRGLL